VGGGADTHIPEGQDSIVGTRAYFAPEKWGEQPGYCRQQADMWSLGVALHLIAFSSFPNGTAEALPILGYDYAAPAGTREVLSTLLENLLKVPPAARPSHSTLQCSPCPRRDATPAPISVGTNA